MKNNKKVALILVIVMSITLILMGCNGTEENTSDIKIQDDKKDESSVSINYSDKNYDTVLVKDYNNLKLDKLNKYNIDVKFNPQDKSYKGKQMVKYVNNENVDLNEVYFHLYPNAFKRKETAPSLFGGISSAYPDGFKEGYMDIKDIKVNNTDVDYSISGKGNTILKVPLDESLKPGEIVEINLEYFVKLPPARDRFGYGDKTFNFGNWYPIAAVYDDEGWNLDPYYSIGDPFYSDTSNYDISIETPKNITIASSGNILSEEIKDNKKIWKIESRLMRDFAWVASEHFKVLERDVDGTLVKVYVLDDNTNEINKLVLDISSDSIDIFNDTFGKYPFGQYSVVQTSFPSGMEYPGIVFIGDKYYNKSRKGYLEIVIAHETGHQWWYSVVGNDEIDEAWLDESITSYSEVVYCDEKYGKEASEKYFKNNVESGYTRVKEILSDDRVLKPLNEYKNWTDYGALAYNKGAIFIHEIGKKYGEDTLYNILKKYFKKYSFLIATTEDFKRVCEEVTGEDLTEMFNKWIYNKN
ncbi:M1 family metallopeptidase [Dethiothermospora halolimnae]|uniref:M1 family metallopeptidase n=1 Tax=Dethiothermospora halolimnae TaxID=3114390 RepID=UPI003CCB7769